MDNSPQCSRPTSCLTTPLQFVALNGTRCIYVQNKSNILQSVVVGENMGNGQIRRHFGVFSETML